MRIKTKEDRRDRIKLRLRKRISGTSERPRLSVFRSVAHIYVQVIDDRTGTTIASASSVEPTLKAAPLITTCLRRSGLTEISPVYGRL